MTCTIETGWECTAAANDISVCTPICNDSLIKGTETCDDGGVVDGDGCSSTCAIEQYWECDGAEPSTCNPIC